VNRLSVAALVNPEIRDDVGEDDYNICLEPTCDVVYYNHGDRYFRKGDLTIRVAFKEPDGPKVVCYCHNLTEDDIIDLMRRNQRAKSFAEVAAILGVGNCSCEERHPFGGNCACAGDIGRVVKLGLADPGISEDSQGARLTKVFIYERNGPCCGPNPSAALAAFLQRQFEGQIEVRKFDFTAAKGSVPVSTSLLDLLRRGRADVLPAMVVDGEVITTGQLPTLMDAVELIEARLKSQNQQSPRPLQS